MLPQGADGQDPKGYISNRKHRLGVLVRSGLMSFKVQKWGITMRKLIISTLGAVALVAAGVLAWNAEATTLTSSTTSHPRPSYSLVEKAGCWLPGLPGECDIGMYHSCDRHGHCKCVRCGGWYPWRENTPGH